MGNWALPWQVPAAAEGWGTALLGSCQGSHLPAAAAAAGAAGRMPAPREQAGCWPSHSCRRLAALAAPQPLALMAAAAALWACRRQARARGMGMAMGSAEVKASLWGPFVATATATARRGAQPRRQAQAYPRRLRCRSRRRGGSIPRSAAGACGAGHPGASAGSQSLPSWHGTRQRKPATPPPPVTFPLAGFLVFAEAAAEAGPAGLCVLLQSLRSEGDDTQPWTD